MPNFLEKTFEQLQKAAGRVVLREIRGAEFVSVSGDELLDQWRGRALIFGSLDLRLATAARCWARIPFDGRPLILP